MADDNGVLILPAEELTPVIDTALQSDLAEPDLLARLRGGEPLDDVLATSFVAGKPHRVLPSS